MIWSSRSAETDGDKANVFNEYFQSVFNNRDTDDLVLVDYDGDYLSFLRVSETAVSKYLHAVKVNKATGPDKFPNRLLKNTSSQLSKSLTIVFQTIINKGVYSSQWKKSLVIPLFKSGNRKMVTQYRPISLSTTVSKIFERIFFDALYEKLSKRFSPSQYSLRKKLSTIVQLIDYVDKLYRYKDDSDYPDIAAL